MRRNDPARPCLGAFYEHNRLRFFAAALLSCVLQTGTLLISWLLGEVVDATGARDAEFLRRAAAQYKRAAFDAVSRKSIGAFTSESVGRYIALLTSDAEKIQENYLAATFWLISQPLTVLGTLGMMLWYSPPLTLATVLFMLVPAVRSMLLSPGLTRRERAVSDASERFVGKVRDLLSGFSVMKSFKAEGETARIFDADNAALDARTAFQVTGDLLRLDGVTRIVVTHSLVGALLKEYDGIIVLKDGRAEEQGGFDDLMERKGYFYALYTVAQ